MFGKKQARIDDLEVEVRTLAGERDVAIANEDKQTTRAHSLSAELDQALEALTSSEHNITDLTEELVRERTINQALADENRDLTRQLQLLQALFKQIGIQIKLPARTK